RPLVGRVLGVTDTNVLLVALSSEVLHMTHEWGVGMKTTGHHDEEVATRSVRIAGLASCGSSSDCARLHAAIKGWLAGRGLRVEIPTSLWEKQMQDPITAVVLDESGKKSINAEMIRRGWATAQVEESGCLLSRLKAVSQSASTNVSK